MISVIIPIFNGEKYLSMCIESILGQSYSDIEIILIDDGSTDNTKKICQYYQEKYANIKCVCQSNQGVSKARNIGLKLARGKYISFVDADDWLEENFYELLIGVMIKYQADISMCDYSVDTHVCKKMQDINVTVYEGHAAVRFVISRMLGGPCDKLYKREAIGKTKFDETILIAEDTLFNAVVMKDIKRLVKADCSLYHYRMWEGNTTRKWTVDKIESGFCAYEKIIQLYKGNADIISIVERAMKCCLLYYFDYSIISGNPELYGYLQNIYGSNRRMRKGWLMMGIRSFIKMCMFCMPYKCVKFFY